MPRYTPRPFRSSRRSASFAQRAMSTPAPQPVQSAIIGGGYGTAHTWARTYTAQVGSNHALKASHYKCVQCPAKFVHKYDLVPNIVEAMEQEGVPVRCEKPAPKESVTTLSATPDVKTPEK